MQILLKRDIRKWVQAPCHLMRAVQAIEIFLQITNNIYSINPTPTKEWASPLLKLQMIIFEKRRMYFSNLL